MTAPLVRLHDSLWECDAPMRVVGMCIGHRMIVVRLPDGTVLVHSPVGITPERSAAVEAIGPVRWIVAPSIVHDTYVDGWFAKYPDATLVGPPGMAAKFSAWPWRAVLGPELAAAWKPDLEFLTIEGVPRLNETVFFHRPSRSVIVADLIFNLRGDHGFLSNTLLRMNGAHDRTATSRLFRSVTKDRKALRRSTEQILAWDFERVIVGHGRNLETNAKEALRSALAWV